MLLVLRTEPIEDRVPGGVFLVAVRHVGDGCTSHIVVGDLGNLVPSSSISGISKAWVVRIEVNKRADLAGYGDGHRAATFRWIQVEMLAQGSRQGMSLVQRFDGTGIADWPTPFASIPLPLPSLRR